MSKEKGLSDHVLIIIIILAGLTFIALIAGLSSLKEVTSFDECFQAGYTITDTEPRQCITPLGNSFTEGPAFCGISTFSHCNAGSGCKVTGCSNQICQGTSEEELVTTCDYQDCYNVPGYECKCLSGQCQWTNQ